MRASFDKRWLLPLSILATSALIAFGIVVFGPSSLGRSYDEVAAQQAASETSEKVTTCSGTSASDYTCHQERYQDLVDDSGVETAFVELKDEYKKNDFVRSGCHQLTHVIGRAAIELYDDVSEAFGHGEHFCGMGYYHGVMETLVTKIGADKVLEEPDALCADLRERQEHSEHHYGCAHGLGHGLMGVYENELFESLYACDALTDGWEREQCYGGVFMQNVMAEDDLNHPSKYLKADRPLYPCTDVETRYKNQCYGGQTSYVLRTQGYDFAKAFDLCKEVEDNFRPRCYRHLGYFGARRNVVARITEVGQSEATNMLCALGEDHETRSYCVIGAVKGFIYHYRSNEQALGFCESFNDAELRDVCHREAEEPYEELFRSD